MRKLVKTKRFERTFRKFVRRDPRLQRRIEETLLALSVDAFTPALETHKLSGRLSSALACSCGYDCRIIFFLDEEVASGDEVIVLVDIGTHDEVY